MASDAASEGSSAAGGNCVGPAAGAASTALCGNGTEGASTSGSTRGPATAASAVDRRKRIASRASTEPVYPAPLVIDTYEFPPSLTSASPRPTGLPSRDSPEVALAPSRATAAEAAGPVGQTGPSEVASARSNADAQAMVPAEVEEDLLAWAAESLSKSPSVAQSTSTKAPVSLSPSSVKLRTNNEASVEAKAQRPLGSRCPSYEALHAVAVEWPSMSLADKGPRYTPPAAVDAAAKLAQATWDAAHKAATTGPVLLAPVSQRPQVLLREAMQAIPAQELMRTDIPRIQHSPSSARAEATWPANTVMHVRRARVVCQEAQSHLMQIRSQDSPVHSRLYDDHLDRMGRFERRKARVRPLSSKLRS